MMHIKINGTPQELPTPLTVRELTERLNLDTRQIAIERNRQIVPRSTYGEVQLNNGDEIEIVRFIGGG